MSAGWIFGLIKTSGFSGEPKASQSDNRKQASLVKFRMWSTNKIGRTKEVLSNELPMTYTI